MRAVPGTPGPAQRDPRLMGRMLRAAFLGVALHLWDWAGTDLHLASSIMGGLPGGLQAASAWSGEPQPLPIHREARRTHQGSHELTLPFLQRGASAPRRRDLELRHRQGRSLDPVLAGEGVHPVSPRIWPSGRKSSVAGGSPTGRRVWVSFQDVPQRASGPHVTARRVGRISASFMAASITPRSSSMASPLDTCHRRSPCFSWQRPACCHRVPAYCPCYAPVGC